MAYTTRGLCATLLALGCLSCSSNKPQPGTTTTVTPSATPTAVSSKSPEPSGGTGGGGTGLSGPGGTGGGSEVNLTKSPKKDPFVPDPPQFMPPSSEKLPGYAKAKYSYVPTLGKDTEVRGKKIFHTSCAPCHGDDGTGSKKPEVISGINLRRAYLYKYGSSERALYRSIKFGIPRTAMGSWEGQLSEDELWALVAYNKSLIGPEVEPGTK